MKKLQSSLDWAGIENEMYHRAHGLSNSNDIRKMIKNIYIDVAKLSKAEVLDRNTHRKYTDELLSNINRDIELVNEYTLVAALLG